MRQLGLLPLVKELQLHVGGCGGGCYFSSDWLHCRILRQFSALTNVQELGTNHLDIPSFMPRIRRYFGHFLPTIRSLILREPKGDRRQIIYFIGMFQHLEDLTLTYHWIYRLDEPVADPTLIPSFAPPLRGRLTLARSGSVEFLTDMIDLFGGIRFRWMDLFQVHGMPPLLGACAGTLETLRLYPADAREEVSR